MVSSVHSLKGARACLQLYNYVFYLASEREKGQCNSQWQSYALFQLNAGYMDHWKPGKLPELLTLKRGRVHHAAILISNVAGRSGYYGHSEDDSTGTARGSFTSKQDTFGRPRGLDGSRCGVQGLMIEATVEDLL